MRSRLAALMLLVVLLLLSAMNLPAAPVPDPSAVLDIGPPQKGTKAEENCKDVIRSLTLPRGYLWLIANIDEVKKLASGARLKEEEVGPWLVKNLRIKEEDGGRRLRFTFRAGTRAEQAAILNAMLRCYMRGVEQSIKNIEQAIRPREERAAQYAKNSQEERDLEKRAELRKMANDITSTTSDERDVVARLKKVSVIKWAK